MEHLTLICFRQELFDDEAQLSTLIDKFASFAGAKMMVFESAAPLERTLPRGANITTALQKQGLNTAALTGADLDCIRGSEQGVARVDDTLLRMLIAQDVAPVIMPLAHDTEGHLHQVGIVDLATQLAIALSWHYDLNLIVCDDQLDNEIKDRNDAMQMSEIEYKGISGWSSAGKNKLDALYLALNTGVQHTVVTCAEQLGTVNGTALTLDGNL